MKENEILEPGAQLGVLHRGQVGQVVVPGDESEGVLLLTCSLTPSFCWQAASPCPLTPAFGAPHRTDGISLIDCGGRKDWTAGKGGSQTQVCVARRPMPSCILHIFGRRTPVWLWGSCTRALRPGSGTTSLWRCMPVTLQVCPPHTLPCSVPGG